MKYIKDIVIIIAVIFVGYYFWQSTKHKEITSTLQHNYDSILIIRDNLIVKAELEKVRGDSLFKVALHSDSLYKVEALKYTLIEPKYQAIIAKLEKQSNNKQVKSFIAATGLGYPLKKYKGDYLIKFPSIQYANRKFALLDNFKERHNSLAIQIQEKNQAYFTLQKSLEDSNGSLTFYKEAHQESIMLLNNQKIQIVNYTTQVKKTKTQATVAVGLALLLALIF